MLVYIEYISRRPDVSLEAFHEVVGRGQTGWAGEYADDRLVLNVARTWRLGPEPEYLAVWYNHAAGLERIGGWERIFASGEAAAFEEPFKLAARIDVAGCYRPLLEPEPGGGGPYYAEYLDFADGVAPDEVAQLFRERAGRHPSLTLKLLVDRIGGLGPDPRGLAFWELPGYGSLEEIAHDLDDGGPVRRVKTGVYVDLGKEIL